MSDTRSPEELTLRERITTAIRLNRELIQHVEQSFIPRLDELRMQTRSDFKPNEQPPDDRAVHAQAATVLEADHLTVELYNQLKTYCQSIRSALDEFEANGRR